MPVVLFEVGGVARSGHLYGDRTGIEYEYPRGRYEKWIQPGERFIYQAPRTGYTGSGVIGQIRPSPISGRLICDVLAVSMFRRPVPLKDAYGNYYEADPKFWKDKVYWGQGVRPLSEPRFDAILLEGGVPDHFALQAVGYANPEVARRVEEYSVDVVVRTLHKRFSQPVTVMPHNNPGFDIRVGPEESPDRYVEVKGTQSPEPVFFVSDGERLFSVRNSAFYTLFVVSGIHLKEGTHEHVAERDGAIAGHDFDLLPSQWRGHLLKPA